MFGLNIWPILIIVLVLFDGRILNARGEAGRSIGSNARWELSPRLSVCQIAMVCRPVHPCMKQWFPSDQTVLRLWQMPRRSPTNQTF